MNDTAHGHIDIKVDGNIVTATYIGQFNHEGITKGISVLRNTVEQFNGAPFAMLVDDLAVEGGTPEAYAELELFNQWVNTQSMVAKAMLIHSKLKLKIIDSLVQSRKQQNIRLFDSHVEAYNWLKSELNLSR